MKRAAVIVGLGTAAMAPRLVRAQETPIHVTTTVGTLFAEPFLSLERGFYKRAGFDATVDGVGNGDLVITAVATGATDIGVTATLQLASAIAHEVPIRLFGYSAQMTTGLKQPLAGLYVAANATIADAKSLEGRTVGVNALQTTNFMGVEEWLQRNGADTAKVKSIEVPFGQIAAALERGTIDAGVLVEPFTSAAKDKVKLLAPVFDLFGPNWSVGVFFAKLDYIRANRSLIQRFVDANYQTAKYFNARPIEANPIFSKYTRVPIDILNAIAPTKFAEGPAPNSARVELELAWKYKLVAKPLTAGDMASLS